jgi:hypothetical protein
VTRKDWVCYNEVTILESSRRNDVNEKRWTGKKSKEMHLVDR